MIASAASVHPHARGERVRTMYFGVMSVGSSPRTWGTLAPDRPAPRSPRFIPTHVGNAPAAPRAATADPVHPHARGERRAIPYVIGASVRFIPTHVGNAQVGASRPVNRAVHPHARGERWIALATTIVAFGSSPRTWGTPDLLIESATRDRFIPTHVGNAAIALMSALLPSVHPHARGERMRSGTVA